MGYYPVSINTLELLPAYTPKRNVSSKKDEINSEDTIIKLLSVSAPQTKIASFHILSINSKIFASHSLSKVDLSSTTHFHHFIFIFFLYYYYFFNWLKYIKYKKGIGKFQIQNSINPISFK